MNKQTTTMTTYSPPGQGQSKKAKQRARKRVAKTTTTTTTTTSQPKKGKNRRQRNRKPNSNEYLDNLLNPDSCIGCRVPDPFTCVPTGTFRLTQDYTINTGDTGGTAFMLRPGTLAVAEATLQPMPDNTYTWRPEDLPGKLTALGIYSRIRPVSAYIMAVFTGSTMNDGGTICGFWRPRGSGFVTDYQQAAGQARSRILPLREGLRVMWAPEDNDDIVFQFGTGANDYSVIGVAINGAANNQAITLRVVINYEGIAGADTTDFVTTEIPKGDAATMRQVRTVLASMTDTVQPLWDGWGKEAAMAAGRTAFNYIGYSVARNFAQRRENTAPRLQYV